MTPVVLRVQLGEPSAIDPGRAFEHDGALVAGLIADPLVDCDPATGRLAPAAADSWEVAPDGLSVRFRLRPGVLFHHGRPVTARDYRYSLSRVVRPETDSPMAAHLAAVEGYEEVTAGRAESLSGVLAPADDELLVRLTRPFHEIAAVFSQRVTAPVPAELVERDPAGFALRPVSNGPYAVAENNGRRPGAGPVLDRFPGYYGANAAYRDGGRGRAGRIEFSVFDDMADACLAFFRGELDVTEVPADAAAQASAAGGAAFHSTPNPMVTFLGFPVPIAPFDDPVVRRAVAMCIDREGIGKRRFAGMRPVAGRMVPPVLDPDGGPRLDLPHDPAAARRLLAERAVPEPERAVRVLFNGGQGHEGWVGDVARDIAEGLGWRVEPQRLDWPGYLRELPHTSGLFRTNWAVDYLSVDNALHPLAHGDAVGESNHARYRGAADALIDRARATLDADARRELYRRAEQRVLADLPYLPLWEGALYHLVDPVRVRPAGPVTDVFGVPVLRQFAVSAPPTGAGR
ncbi:ABC transporter substrate-binding protein [Actinacidiphila sp. ITFR-21]|uniref:ABC transporter substrate-binding protein n=1 Tax=Actinacidiphila sp. ITFR-21 TaxID=3075199 RepID=UPI00288A34A1|nr:ABC transporter substrate-binding protein [Streptomyces sp. ITFR-21]WNI18650.1 ABC transporter substrate-binding protein [Streptomyces sp. ITFR-21]